jgi:hypothetical protein
MALMPRTTFSRPFGNKVVTPPAVEPVTLQEAKDHMRITDGDSDRFIIPLIREAREILEEYSSIAFINQTWKLTISYWPSGTDQWWSGTRELPITELYGGRAPIIIPRYPFQSITTMTVYDESSNSSVVDVADTFDLDTNSRRGELRLKSGSTWPVALRATNPIEIDYVAGFGATNEDVPAALRRAIRVLVAYLYEHRGSCGAAKAIKESGAGEIVRLYRDMNI